MSSVHCYFELFIIVIISILILTSFRQICDISHTRGKEFSKYLTRVLELEVYNEEYEWWRVRLLIDGFNKACSNISASYLNVEDNSMSELRFPTTSKGYLPHLSYIFRKPESLGT